MIASKESVIGGKGTWVRTFKDKVVLFAYKRLFLSRITAPKHKYDGLLSLCKKRDYPVRQYFPALTEMTLR